LASDSFGDLGLRFAHYSSRRSDNNWAEYSGGSKDSLTLRADYAINSHVVFRSSFVHTDLDAQMAGGLNETDYLNSSGKSINTFSYRKDKTTRVNASLEADTVENGISTLTVFKRGNDHGQIPSYTMLDVVAPRNYAKARSITAMLIHWVSISSINKNSTG